MSGAQIVKHTSHTSGLFRRLILNSTIFAAKNANLSVASAKKMLHISSCCRIIQYNRTSMRIDKLTAADKKDLFFISLPSKSEKRQCLGLTALAHAVHALSGTRCEFVTRWENIIALGPSGTGNTHAALGLGLAACQKGMRVRFITAAALVHEMIEAVDERRLQRLQKQLAAQDLLIMERPLPVEVPVPTLRIQLVWRSGAVCPVPRQCPQRQWLGRCPEARTGAILGRGPSLDRAKSVPH